MPFYIRKGVNLGPLRVNLSKGGVGLSVGGKGLRAGIDVSGRKYTHAGRGGLYWRDRESNSRGINLSWILMLVLGLGLWYAQTHGWLDDPQPRHHHSRSAED